MSVTPQSSTVEKIIGSIANNAADTEAISRLWREEKVWHVEIDSRLFTDKLGARLNPKEMTALYLHEIGHIAYSNSVPTRLITILQYEVIKSTYNIKALLQNDTFRKILSPPILSAGFMENSSRSAIKEEIEADKFVKKVGYQKYLFSAFNKFLEASAKDAKSNEESMKIASQFSIDTLNQFKERRAALVKSNLGRISVESSSPVLKKSVDEILSMFFMTSESAGSLDSTAKLNAHYFFMEKAEERYVTEVFGLFKPKPLPRIDPSELDYIVLKTQAIFSRSDKMMLVAYIHSKLDVVDYYMAVLNDPKESRKYLVPYTKQELTNLRARLLKSVDDVIDYKIGTKGQVLVSWPDGYEG